MEDSRLRMTPQRRVILDELLHTKRHPTADELYSAVRQRIPNISLGTVYRNLEVLSSQGAVRKIEVGGTQRRFDADVSCHHHIRCTECGRVDDVHTDLSDEIERKCARATGYEVRWHHVEFTGVCPECRKKLDAAAKG